MIQINKKNRRHLASDFDAENAQHVANVIALLKSNTPHDFASAGYWYDLFSELSDATNEIQTQLDLQISLDTSSREHAKRIENFERDILTQLMNSRAHLMDIYLQSSWRTAMHSDDNGKIEKEVQTRRKLTSPKLAGLQIEENSLVREFKSFNANTSCNYFGRPTPLGVVIGKLNDPRPEVRKEAFLAHWRKLHSSRDWLEGLFTKLLKNRIEQANVSGAGSYTNLCFTELGRFDYTPADCKTFRNSIFDSIVPLVSNLQ